MLVRDLESLPEDTCDSLCLCEVIQAHTQLKYGVWWLFLHSHLDISGNIDCKDTMGQR